MDNKLPDDPIIARLMREGVPEWRAPKCPICEEDCCTVYMNNSEIFACENCLVTGDANEYENDGEITPCHSFVCPSCGDVVTPDETIEIYFDRFGEEVICCGNCVGICDAVDVEECFYDDNE